MASVRPWTNLSGIIGPTRTAGSSGIPTRKGRTSCSSLSAPGAPSSLDLHLQISTSTQGVGGNAAPPRDFDEVLALFAAYVGQEDPHDDPIESGR